MTLAIAGEVPWGEWQTVVRSLPGAHHEGAVVLAADTRWSYRDGKPPFNKGRKLWTLGKQTGFVLAGDVWSGEDAILRLREAGQDEIFKHASEVIARAAIVFRETYRAHKEKADRGQRPPCGPLFYLMGLVDSAGNTSLVRLASESDFSPVYLSGVHAIGIPSAVSAARQALLEGVGRLKNSPSLTSAAEPWAMHVAGAIDDVIETGNELSVGGRVQIVIGDKTGWREIPMSLLSPGADAEVNDNWRDATYALAQLMSCRRAGFRPLAACETIELRTLQIA